MRLAIIGLGAVLAGACRAPSAAADLDLRINQIQSKGSHNSYHVASPGAAPGGRFDYTRAPIEEQLEVQGMRHLEFDVHFDPEGNVRVYHLETIDERSRCDRLATCLAIVKAWSDAHRGHALVTVLVEFKDPPGVVSQHASVLDATLASVWPRERVLTPGDVRGTAGTLRDAVLAGRWPTVAATRGKVAFVLMNLEGRASAWLRRPPVDAGWCFVTGEPQDPHAAFILRDDPEAARDEIRELVARGFMVRTRADTEEGEPAGGWAARAGAALASGAQLVTTDYGEVTTPSRYVFALPGGMPSRCNPVNAPPGCLPPAIERRDR